MVVNNIDIAYGSKIIFKNFSITFEDNKVTSIMGPSGCGKTSLLNSIAYNKINTVSYIFQEPRLLPWFTVEKNIELVLNGSHKERKERALFLLNKVGLIDRSKDFPTNLSGGERQRVSIARAFAHQSPILLMDEPFQSQDLSTKKNLISTVLKIQEEEQRTILAVSHDIQDTLMLNGRVVVIGGRPVVTILDTMVKENSYTEIAEAINKAQGLLDLEKNQFQK